MKLARTAACPRCGKRYSEKGGLFFCPTDGGFVNKIVERGPGDYFVREASEWPTEQYRPSAIDGKPISIDQKIR